MELKSYSLIKRQGFNLMATLAFNELNIKYQFFRSIETRTKQTHV